jgi:hypothetical protein
MLISLSSRREFLHENLQFLADKVEGFASLGGQRLGVASPRLARRSDFDP